MGAQDAAAGPLERAGVVGAGLMGHGIAQVLAVSGAEVSVYDPDPGALETLRTRIELTLRSLGQPTEAAARVSPAGSLAEVAEGAQIVVEAVPEDLGLKRRIFGELDAADAGVVLATNTSVISVSEIAAGLDGAERVVGTHWWNPPSLIPLVEVVEGRETSAAVVARTMAYLEAAGKTPVHVRRDVPGFIGNRLQHALWREALSLVDAGVCDPETVDMVIRAGFGPRLAAIGPIENADLIGLDLTHAIHEYLLPHLDRSVTPAAGLRERIERGELGAKSGRGYLRWEDGAADEVHERIRRALKSAPPNQRQDPKEN